MVLVLLVLFDVCKLTDAVAFSNAHFGRGAGPIYLDNIDCSGSESNLFNCSNSSVVSCASGHWDDAGVRCQGRFISACICYVPCAEKYHNPFGNHCHKCHWHAC